MIFLFRAVSHLVFNGCASKGEESQEPSSQKLKSKAKPPEEACPNTTIPNMLEAPVQVLLQLGPITDKNETTFKITAVSIN